MAKKEEKEEEQIIDNSDLDITKLKNNIFFKRRHNIRDEEDDNKTIDVVAGWSKRTKAIFSIVGVIFIAVAVIFIIRALKYKTYNAYEIIESVKTSGDNVADYEPFADSVVKVTKDGTSFIDQQGNTVWDSSYSMKMPVAVVNGDYVVVADLNGNDVYLFNKSGKVSSQTLDYQISNVDVANQGVYVLSLNGEDCNYINAYDKNSSKVYEMKTSIEKSGYPLDVAISDDGEKLFTSFVKIDGTKVTNYLAAYNYSSVGQNENADRLVGGFTFEDTVFPYIDFVDNDTVVCYGDNKIEIYAMPEKPSKKAEIDLGEVEMKGIFGNKEFIGYITETDKEDAKYQVVLYDLDGHEKSKTDFNGDYDSIYSTEDEIIIVGDFNAAVFYNNGIMKFSTTFGKSLLNFVPNGKNQEYIVIFENETETIKLRNKDK